MTEELFRVATCPECFCAVTIEDSRIAPRAYCPCGFINEVHDGQSGHPKDRPSRIEYVMLNDADSDALFDRTFRREKRR